MKLTRASNYALHALVYLAAQRSDSLIGSHDIARSLGITENRLVRILKSLVSARVLWSLRGPGGGYRLARPASRVSVLEVIEGVDGRLRGVAPALARPGHEATEHRLEVICAQLAEWTRNVLAKITISDLLDKADRGVGAAGALQQPTQKQVGLPPEVAEGLEQIRRLMAARDGGLEHRDDGGTMSPR